MRLGAYDAKLAGNSHTARMYGGAEMISERHRHRYEVNSAYIEPLEKQGLVFAGMSPDGLLPEIVERPDHPRLGPGSDEHHSVRAHQFDQPLPIALIMIGASCFFIMRVATRWKSMCMPPPPYSFGQLAPR